MQPIPNLFLFGPPGSGKGTWSKALQEFGYESIGMGDVLRAEVQRESPLGQSLREYVDGGKLIPDEMALSIAQQAIISRIFNQKPFVLEGFPSTVKQFEAFVSTLAKLGISTNKIVGVQLECDDATAAFRITGRLICRECSSIFNIKSIPPKQRDSCDRCDSRLHKRVEDTYETALQRIQNYRENTLPIMEIAKLHFKVIVIDANKPFSEVFRSTF